MAKLYFLALGFLLIILIILTVSELFISPGLIGRNLKNTFRKKNPPAQ